MCKYKEALEEIKLFMDKSNAKNDGPNFDGDVIHEYNYISRIVRDVLKKKSN